MRKRKHLVRIELLQLVGHDHGLFKVLPQVTSFLIARSSGTDVSWHFSLVSVREVLTPLTLLSRKVFPQVLDRGLKGHE